MEKNNSIKTETYKTAFDGFHVDIVEQTDTLADNTTERIYSAWLYHEEYGIKEMIFGCMEETVKSKNAFVDMVEAELNDHIEEYMRKYANEYLYDDMTEMVMNYTEPNEVKTIADAEKIVSQAFADGWKIPLWFTPEACLAMCKDIDDIEE